MDQILLLLLLLVPILSNQSSARVLLSSAIQPIDKPMDQDPVQFRSKEKLHFLNRNGEVGTHALGNLSPLVVGRAVYRLPLSGEGVRFSDIRRRHAAPSSSQCQTQHLCTWPSATIFG